MHSCEPAHQGSLDTGGGQAHQGAGHPEGRPTRAGEHAGRARRTGEPSSGRARHPTPEGPAHQGSLDTGRARRTGQAPDGAPPSQQSYASVRRGQALRPPGLEAADEIGSAMQTQLLE